MLDRKSAPAFAEVRNLTLPTHNTSILENGLPITLLNGVAQEVVKIDVVFTASKWNEPSVGVAHFTSAMLEKGTKKMNSFQIASFFERYGASIEISSGFDFTTITLYSPSKNIVYVLPVFIDLFTEPEFPESELSILKNLFLQSLTINNEKTSYVASKIFRSKIFGKMHPYGASIEKENVDNISARSLSSYFNNFFKPHHIFATGNINDELNKLLIICFSPINRSQQSDKQKQIDAPQIHSDKFYLEKSNSIQTSIRYGKRVVNKTHSDYPYLVLLNHILGGYFGSRLMKNIREEKGLTYGIYSSISTLKNDAYLVIGADVNKENKDIVIDEIKNELIKLNNSSISDSEFKLTKNHLLGNLQLELASPFSVIEKIKNIELYHLSENFYSDLFQKILMLQPAELTEVANKYLKDDFFEISVG
jgi:predicted Zn-dependent peptidase